MKADAPTEAAVLAVLEPYLQAVEQQGIEHLLALFAPDPDVVFIGTGADEQRVGLAELRMQAERDFAQSEGFSLEWGWSSVSAAGSVAWVAVNGVVHARVAGQEMHLPLRVTAVLEERGGRWLLVQGHGSMPTPGQAEGQSFPTK